MTHPAHPDYWHKLLSRPRCFDPITAITVAATAISAVGAIQQASAASKADKYNATLARQNAGIATDQANSQLAQQQRQAQLAFGSAKARAGGSGITSDGSPMDVLSDSFTQSELDANTIIYNGKLRAAGYTNQASMYDASAKNDMTAGYMKAASTALLGGTKSYNAYDSVGSGPLPWQGSGNVNPAGGFY